MNKNLDNKLNLDKLNLNELKTLLYINKSNNIQQIKNLIKHKIDKNKHIISSKSKDLTDSID